MADYLHAAIDSLPKHQNRAALHQQVEHYIDDYIAYDPKQTFSGSELVIPICETLGLPYDEAKMHDDLVFLPSAPYQRRTLNLDVDDEPDIPGPDPP